MAASSLIEIAQRLIANVDGELGDQTEAMMNVPVTDYTDPARFEREMEAIYHRSPLLVALSCDIAAPGQYSALTIAGRSMLIVRGDDGVARTFFDICRHRGARVTTECFGQARRFTCPYHFWVYDTKGALVGNTARESFADLDVTGLIELPTAERSGAVFAVLTPGVPLDIDEWLGDMASALDALKLDGLLRHRDGLPGPSGNWKATADGYVDGYHLGYLHRSTIGTKSLTNRNTFDLFGPHVRLGFANKPITELRDKPVEDWGSLREAMSLVHYVFPNVSISGLPDAKGLMLSRIHPGPTVGECTVEQFQYFREPMDTDAKRAEADAKRDLYYQVTTEEDFATVVQVTRAAGAIPGDVFRFGRNEMGNQNLHRWAAALADGLPRPA